MERPCWPPRLLGPNVDKVGLLAQRSGFPHRGWNGGLYTKSGQREVPYEAILMKALLRYGRASIVVNLLMACARIFPVHAL